MPGRRTAGPRHGPALFGGSRSLADFLLPDGYSRDTSLTVCRCVGFPSANRKLPRGTIRGPGPTQGHWVDAAALVLCGTLALRPVTSKGSSQSRCSGQDRRRRWVQPFRLHKPKEALNTICEKFWSILLQDKAYEKS